MNYSATQLANKLNISRSYLYQLKENGICQPSTSPENKIIWSEEVYNQINDYLKDKEPKNDEDIKSYKTTKINNRRFLGNKYKLLPFILNIVKDECEGVNTVADIFAGTGAVASAFIDKKIITNDIMYSNYVCHKAWFSSQDFSHNKIIYLIKKYNEIEVESENYMSLNFSNTYFSAEDCRKIGYIREDIETRFLSKEINDREKALLLTSLLYAMDKIANTCGHYDAYRKGVVYEKHLELSVPLPDESLNENNMCYNQDANELVKEIEADLVYIDPPYNSRQYCDAYHLLENVARWEKPDVHGIAKKMDRSDLKSDYCTQKATIVFEDLVNSIHAKYILLSYNNMAQKGNDRSNAKISDEDIVRILQKKGEVKIFEEDYKAFSTGKSDIKENKERIFLCTCFAEEKEVIPSALNYTGGKYKLLPQIMPLFPKDIDIAYDLFCGGCNVGINLNCNKVVFNDKNQYVIGILNAFKHSEKNEIFELIFETIEKYNLSLVSKYGYKYYDCDSSKGLACYNEEGFKRLRNDFNYKTVKDKEYYLLLYVLMVYSFNNQLRFNSKGKFNLPVGKRDFNSKMQKKLEAFIDRIKSADYQFASLDFRNIKASECNEKSFFYVDPPYLISCATYNEQGGWSEQDEIDLLKYLDDLHDNNIRFALSNVIEHKGRTNEILKKWIESNEEKYKLIDLDYNYKNSNYQSVNCKSETREVLVINY